MSRFPLFQPDAPCIGRVNILKRIVGELTKPSPAHISLVGPRYSGKSVLLHAITASLQSVQKYYQAVIYWDLGHKTPCTDAEFIALLRKQIAVAIKSDNPDEAAYLEEVDAGYDELHEVLGILGKSDKRILMLWDGFDRPLQEGSLTRNLWDNLLELCRMPAFRVVTASRRRLRELIRDAHSATSEFWGVFDPVTLPMMNVEDVQAFADSMNGCTFSPGALSEVFNWSGGFPPLIAWIMNRVSDGSASNEHINGLAAARDEVCVGLLEQIWSDCPAAAKDAFRDLVEVGTRKASELSKPERLALCEAGLCIERKGMLEPSCRLLVEHIGGEAPEFGALARLFGNSESYTLNIRGILERRLSHINRFDETLFHMVERAIEDIPSHPNTCLNALSHIEDHALDLIWNRECDSHGELPGAVVSAWTSIPKINQQKIILEMMEADEAGRPDAWAVPRDRVKQLALLQFLTGSHQTYKQALARYATKDTYVLLNAIHTFRNRTQHAAGQAIPLGVAVSGLMLCIELLACLQPVEE